MRPLCCFNTGVASRGCCWLFQALDHCGNSQLPHSCCSVRNARVSEITDRICVACLYQMVSVIGRLPSCVFLVLLHDNIMDLCSILAHGLDTNHFPSGRTDCGNNPFSHLGSGFRPQPTTVIIWPVSKVYSLASCGPVATDASGGSGHEICGTWLAVTRSVPGHPFPST